MTDKERVLAKWPDAVAIWTSRGWRVIVVPVGGGEVREVGRTKSGHVPEDDAWSDAASRLEKETQGL